MKIQRNYVSYFEAGYLAALADIHAYTPEKIEEMLKNDLGFINRIKEMNRAYCGDDSHEDGMKRMFSLI